MLEQFKYINHLAEVFEFGKEGIFVDYNDLHNYSWNVDTKGNRIASFTRGVQTRNLPVIIMCDSEENGIAARNRLHEVVEKDVLAKKPGKIVLGNYYFTCFITSSEKTDYLISKKHMKVNLTLTSDQPFWVKETTVSFAPGSGNASDGKNYPGNYPYNYASNVQDTELVNTDFVASNFRMVIYGSATNPSVNIADHVYQVNVNLNSGEYLIIDSVSKTIKKINADGSETNVFSSRNRSSYIFEKIPSGANVVAWNGSFNFDVIILEERSEPLWI